ncbi:MAG TPA: ABC transporter ATP-binding protein [Lachnospiraceae bacterium]|nr:ABC transporter ATP-binding protein [Lachnospiraceae bacterium]
MILEAVNIGKIFGRGNGKASGVRDVNLTIKEEQYHCIFGSSGSGKSTILNMMAGMLTPTRGNIYLNREDLYGKRENDRTRLRVDTVGYIMQGESLLSNLTVYENIVFPLRIARQEVIEAQVEELIEKMELTDLLDSYPTELSGGEYRRVAVARTVLCNPKFIIADEPTSNLDERNAKIIRDIFEELYERGTAILVATHDLQFKQKHHSIYYIENGVLMNES